MMGLRFQYSLFQEMPKMVI
ncbi:hypothetical protein RDABS01_014599 [Bienertia sinuspersici]